MSTLKKFCGFIICLVIYLMTDLSAQAYYQADFFDYYENHTDFFTYWQIFKRGGEILLDETGLNLSVDSYLEPIVIKPKFDFSAHSAWIVRYDFVLESLDFVEHEFIVDYQDEDNYQSMVLLPDSKGYRRVVKDGEVANKTNPYDTRPSSNIDWQAGVTYTIQIAYKDGGVNFTIWPKIKKSFDRAAPEHTHYTYSDQWFIAGVDLENRPGPVLKQSQLGASQGVTYQNFFVFNYDDSEQLKIHFFSQLDPLWKDDELGNAYRFGKNMTIGSHGCALTSAAMVLNYHGFTHLPYRSTIVNLNPRTLNQWLKEQPNGYASGTLLSWEALSKLTDQIATAMPGLNLIPLQTSAFTGVGSYYAHTAELIHNKEPVIFSIPGHFTVGTGATYNRPYIYVHDPLNQAGFTRTRYPSINYLRRFTPTVDPDHRAVVINYVGPLSFSIYTGIYGKIDKVVETQTLELENLAVENHEVLNLFSTASTTIPYALANTTVSPAINPTVYKQKIFYLSTNDLYRIYVYNNIMDSKISDPVFNIITYNKKGEEQALFDSDYPTARAGYSNTILIDFDGDRLITQDNYTFLNQTGEIKNTFLHLISAPQYVLLRLNALVDDLDSDSKKIELSDEDLNRYFWLFNYYLDYYLNQGVLLDSEVAKTKEALAVLRPAIHF